MYEIIFCDREEGNINKWICKKISQNTTNRERIGKEI